ncbi:GLE1-like protein-domain-containing protein [Fimicolochytrium jonesii]|uniref:GLE1-like protein-domain-containing protein n=1 Tax=Fimicolochytrium jonesii TaxID=1396493 RepID=UPI0022FDE762|nr:GLE1-like protein-domain-containing protein [Fimicolochytrium jonesii]KAI8827026.1 GLE1-like protein-domain-containing protein [Fimicolochytrium jonesii]
MSIKSIEAALRILEERERKERERLEAEKRRKEEAARAVQQAKEEAERKAAADALAKQEADAEARRQAAEAAARKADEQRATEAKEAQDAANQAAAQAAQQSTAQAAAAMSKFMPDEVMEKAKERMALIDSIKADLKPLFKSGTNSNMTNAVFKAKMTFTRRLGQVMNSQKKIIEIAKDIDQVLKGAKSVSSEAYRLCMDILAKQIIKQCENEVAVKMDTAFPLAILCIMLYNAHPDFLDILLGKMSKRCPYVVPYFPARLKGESDDDFRLKLGYRKIVEWETRAQYAERMGGILALYAAIVQTDSVPHIHGIDFAWIWLSRMLNMKPRRVSPGLILRFLEMAGSQFLPRFGKQAEKMIVYIRDVYMPMIPADAVAAATRLQLFLDDVCKTGRVPVPEGRSLLP